MAAYETGTEAVLLGGKIGGDEGNDVRWEAVEGSERVLPFVNVCQHGRGIMIKLGDLIQRDSTKSVKICSPKTPRSFATYDGEKAVRFSSSFKAKTSCERDRLFPG